MADNSPRTEVAASPAVQLFVATARRAASEFSLEDHVQEVADLCRLLLAQVPAVCLFVRPENTPALRLYDSTGMTRELTYRSLVF